MNSINLYLLSRINDNIKFNDYIKSSSQYLYKKNIKVDEQLAINSIVNSLLNFTDDISIFDGFYCDFTIPHISKEMDLLKFSNCSTLNIELKSQGVPKDEILNQLLQNQYYLKSISSNNYF